MIQIVLIVKKKVKNQINNKSNKIVPISKNLWKKFKNKLLKNKNYNNKNYYKFKNLIRILMNTPLCLQLIDLKKGCLIVL